MNWIIDKRMTLSELEEDLDNLKESIMNYFNDAGKIDGQTIKDLIGENLPIKLGDGSDEWELIENWREVDKEVDDRTEEEKMLDERETKIRDGMGNIHEGIKLYGEECMACPYWKVDVNGDRACFRQDYDECEFGIYE